MDWRREMVENLLTPVGDNKVSNSRDSSIHIVTDLYQTCINRKAIVRPPTIDNYLRVVYEAGEEVGLEMVTTGLVAKRLNVAQSTATVAIQRLAREGMLSYEAYYGAKLTNAGRKRAQQTVRKHRILESFLTRVLNLNWAETHAQAQFSTLVKNDSNMALTECREGVGFVLCRVLGHNPNLLRYLNEMRLGIGAKGVVLANASEGGPMVVCL